LGTVSAQGNVLTPVVNLGATIAAPIPGGSHDKIKLYDFNNGNTVNYAIGAEDHAVWFSVDSSLAGFKFYNGNVANTRIGGDGTISTTGNVTASSVIATSTQTNTITSINNNNIYIDPQLSGMAFIQLPTFQDGGEQLVINNHFAYSNGIVLVTETGSFHFLGNSVTFPDGTTQSTAFTGVSNTFNAITMNSTPSGPSNQINYGLGNLVSWLDGGWTIGEYNGTGYGTEGIRINPGIEGPVNIDLPSDANAASTPMRFANWAGNVEIQSYNGNTWTFNNAGGLTVPVVNNTQKSINGSVETVAGDPFPGSCGTSPTTVWTASASDILGAKMTVRTQDWSNGGVEMFDVLIAKEPDGANVSFSVSNRLKTNDLNVDTTVNVDLDGSGNLILVLTSDANWKAVTYSVTEFKRTYD
jgi:hypothetical protein